MSYSQPTPRLPRSADAQAYAEWAVRRIGRAFALAAFGPVVVFGGALALSRDSDTIAAVTTISSLVCVVLAIASLCFARAPH